MYLLTFIYIFIWYIHTLGTDGSKFIGYSSRAETVDREKNLFLDKKNCNFSKPSSGTQYTIFIKNIEAQNRQKLRTN